MQGKYLQGRNRNADVENRVVDTVGEAEGVGRAERIVLKYVHYRMQNRQWEVAV